MTRTTDILQKIAEYQTLTDLPNQDGYNRESIHLLYQKGR